MSEFHKVERINILDDNCWLFKRGTLNCNEVHYIDYNGILSLFQLARIEDIWADRINAFTRYNDNNPSMDVGDIFQNFVCRLNANGSLLPTPWGNHYVSYSSKRHLFRGEPRVYPRSLPSLIRKVYGKSEYEQAMWKAIADLRIRQFNKFIMQFDILKQWVSCYDINIKALAQHYGFETCLLDLTNDIRIALFFATCKYIPEKDGYEPLNERDITLSASSRYGVIYHTPDWMIDVNQGGAMKLCNMKDKMGIDNGDCDGIAFQIGLQPFRRCDYQSGYIYPMRYSVPLQEDYRFETIYFEQSVELSKFIYEMMDGGKKVFPYEGIRHARRYIDELKKSFTFSEAEVSYVYENEYIDKTNFPDLNSFKLALSKFDYDGHRITITSQDTVKAVDSWILKKINQIYYKSEIADFLKYGKVRVQMVYK